MSRRWILGRARARTRLARKRSGPPVGPGGEDAGEDFSGSGTGERSHGTRLFAGVAQSFRIHVRLHFEDGVDALDGNVDTGGVRKDGRGIQLVINRDVDLAGALALGIDDEGGRGSVALGQISREEVEPLKLRCCPVGGGVFKEADGGEAREHFVLNAAEDFGDIDLSGVGHGGRREG